MTPEEENLTVSAKLIQQIEKAGEVIEKAANKAAANGLTTRAEAVADKKSINFTTLATAGGMIFAGLPLAASLVWFLLNQLVDPVKTEQANIRRTVRHQDRKIDAIMDRFSIPKPPKEEDDEPAERQPAEK